MANLDSRVASLLDRAPHLRAEEDEDALIASLEEDDDHVTNALREKRLEQLHAEISRAKTLRSQSHGTYQTIRDEKAILEITTTTKLSVVHFFKPDFRRCRMMDRHLQLLAERHLDTRFIRVDVEDVPFLVTRLKVQILPCVIAFVDGVGRDRLLGFEGTGKGGDDVDAKDVETRLLMAGVLVRPKLQQDDDGAPLSKTRPEQDGQDDDEDWDD